MSTIEKILWFTISEKQIAILKEIWLVNWIWGQWQNIEELLLNIIKWAYWFDNNKANKLLDDIRQLSIIHDLSYSFKLWFHTSNYLFAKRLFMLLHWDKWYSRVCIFIFTLWVLNKYWKEYY